MSSVMLIDARHSEETRVGVMTKNRLAEFDYETASKTQIKGNLYLAKVTRVEPSLQAAFVEYGGNRQGFLAFSEIHPDYYQIPAEDREALLAEEAELVKKEQAEEKPQAGKKGQKDDGGEGNEVTAREAKNLGADDLIDEQLLNKRRVRALKRRYKIQEVIKKRQVLLVQAVKEERGTKGAAMTTYLSLPGRYCVLMPNTTHGNGISRKIGDGKERHRLKKILDSFTVPAGMGCIVRTAGMGRTKVEIKRDLDYLFKAWAEIRQQTLKSTAPALIYEEGNLIKRSLRDLYDKHINEILVEGEEGYKLAHTFMKDLIPSHAKKVKHYQGKEPLFHKYNAEKEIDSLFAPVITLPSGGYIVINPTEALVAIDVNSGKATKEHNIEETALRTNIEAAEEIARQLRLRDIAGLIVIDFIDMEYMGNVKTIERKFREALKADKARIFTNRISALGLLEMSRQRLRASLYEISTQPCPHCEASGRLPSPSTLALRLLRHVEDLAFEGRFSNVLVQAPQELALYILNAKRRVLEEIEERYGVKVTVTPNPKIRMPHFDIQGLSEERMNAELEKDSTLAAFVLGDEEAGAKPSGFGKSDGKGAFPGKKRRRGGRRRPGRHQNEDHRHEARRDPGPQGDSKPVQEKTPDKQGAKKPEENKPAAKKPEDKKAPAKDAQAKPQEKPKPPAPPKKEEKPQPAKKAEDKKPEAKPAAPKAEEKPKPEPKPEVKKPSGPKKSGWWARRKSAKN